MSDFVDSHSWMELVKSGIEMELVKSGQPLLSAAFIA
jgi:hypothetical protein